jgi:hypothetical protein
MAFGGVEGALSAMVRLRRPRLIVRIGRPIAPVQVDLGKPRRAQLDRAAQGILARVVELLPDQDRPASTDVAEEVFSIEVAACDRNGDPVATPSRLRFAHGSSLGRLLYHPALVITFRDRLQLPVQPFVCLADQRDPASIAHAASSVLGYLEDENPYFLVYRFGNSIGGAMREGLMELRDLAAWAADEGHELEVTPIRRFRRRGETEWVEQRTTGDAHAW